jgi:hypothetical protein
VARLIWLLLAALLILGGLDVRGRGLFGAGPDLAVGVGAGICCGLAGSLVHDLLVRPVRRRR